MLRHLRLRLVLGAALAACVVASVLKGSSTLQHPKQPQQQPPIGGGGGSGDLPAAACSLRGGATGEERTYAMLKPDVASDAAKVAAIKELIQKEGLTIEREECAKLSRRQCEAFYAEHKDRAFFPDLVSFMSSGPVVKLELSGPQAIKRWRALLGPTNSLKARTEAPQSVRALFGTDQQENAAHGSDAPEAAAREIELMFQ